MTFVASVGAGLRSYARFRGRASRSELWWWALFVLVVDLTTGSIDDLLELFANLDDRSALLVTGVLVLLLPSVAVIIRRLHDTGRSGWWYALPVVPGFFVLFNNPATPLPIPALVAAAVAVVVLLVWLCLPGTRGPNCFGLRAGDIADVFGNGAAPAPPDQVQV